jgi:hypothetical protein
MPKRKTLYSVHPGVAMLQKWINELQEKSGRSLDQWLKYIQKEGPAILLFSTQHRPPVSRRTR